MTAVFYDSFAKKGKKPVKVFYSHSREIYATEQEKRELKQLKALLKEPDYIIVNPNPDLDGMDWDEYFIKFPFDFEIIVFSSILEDNHGFIGHGVFREIDIAIHKRLPVYYLYRGKLYDFTLGHVFINNWKRFVTVTAWN